MNRKMQFNIHRQMKTYVYAVTNHHCHILDGIVFRNRNEAAHAIHMVCDAHYERDFNLMGRHRYNNWLSKIVKGYWNGDYSKEHANKELKKLLKKQTKYSVQDIWCTAVYWDFYEMFYIDEQPVVENMTKLYNNITKMKSNIM